MCRQWVTREELAHCVVSTSLVWSSLSKIAMNSLFLTQNAHLLTATHVCRMGAVTMPVTSVVRDCHFWQPPSFIPSSEIEGEKRKKGNKCRCPSWSLKYFPWCSLCLAMFRHWEKSCLSNSLRPQAQCIIAHSLFFVLHCLSSCYLFNSPESTVPVTKIAHWTGTLQRKRHKQEPHQKASALLKGKRQI